MFRFTGGTPLFFGQTVFVQLSAQSHVSLLRPF
jgi:hypothetical protein